MGSASIETMAKVMGVTSSDVLSLASMVSEALTKDDMKDIVFGMSEGERVDVTCAYVATEVRKFSDFCLSLLTNTEKKSAFDRYLLTKLKG